MRMTTLTKTRAISDYHRTRTTAIFNGNFERKNQTNWKSDCSILPLNMAGVRVLWESEIALVLVRHICDFNAARIPGAPGREEWFKIHPKDQKLSLNPPQRDGSRCKSPKVL